VRLDGEVPARWTLLLPVRLATPKGRLATWDRTDRMALAEAMVRDVIDAARSCEFVDHIVVVADSEAAAVLDEVKVVPDSGAGLNAEVARAAAHYAAVAVLLPDVPAVTTGDLTTALDRGAHHERAFIADAEGVGTTMLMSRLGAELAPAFGDRSCAAHAASGAAPILDDVPGQFARLRRDVDDEIGLWDARRLGVGPHTAALL